MGICPHCGMETHKSHGVSSHSAQWMPLSCVPMAVHFDLRRYFCVNPECSYYGHSFVESLEKLNSYKRNSENIFLILFAISLFCSCSGTAQIARLLGIDISHDTVRNLLDSIPLIDDPDIEEIGVDDVANYKGMTYCTAIYDARDHHMIALLEGRDGSEFKEWLKNHPRIKYVARDRASAYAKAIKDVLPDCIQVADRFHILKNLTDRLYEIFKADLPAKFYIRGRELLDEEKVKSAYVKRELICDPAAFASIHVDNSAPVDANGKVIVVNSIEMHHKGKMVERQAENRQIKQDKAIQVRNRKSEAKAKGEKLTLKMLAEEFGVSVVTIRKWLSMSEKEVQQLSEVNHYAHHKSKVDGYENIIYKLMKNGKDPLFIKSYLAFIGCPAGGRAVEDKIGNIANNHFHDSVKVGRNTFDKFILPPDIREISRFDVLQYMVAKDRTKMTAKISDDEYQLIKAHYPIIQRCEDAWTAFYHALMGHKPDDIDVFIQKYKVDEDTEKDEFTDQIGPFVNGLIMDLDAVKAAATYKLNSGFVEGENCRFKELKRVAFGRAGLGHLQQLCCLAGLVTKHGSSILELLEKRSSGQAKTKNSEHQE